MTPTFEYKITNEPHVFSSRNQKLKEEVFRRLLPNRLREGTFTGPEPDGKTPFLDTFEENTGLPYAACLAKAIANSWSTSKIIIYPHEMLVGVPRPTRPLYEHFSWGIVFNAEILEHPSYAKKKEMYLKRYSELFGRLNPLDYSHVEQEGLHLFGSSEIYKALEQLWWVAGYQGHTIPNYEKLLSKGIGGLLDEIAQYRRINTAEESQVLYDACEIILKGIAGWMLSYAEHAEALALAATYENEKDSYMEIAGNCRAILSEPPKTFHEAIQLLWFYSLWDCVDCLGRCDQYLYPFYKKDLTEGRLDDKGAFEAVSALWMKFLEHGIHNITLGGVAPDGKDAVNELTYMMLEATRALHETHPRISIRVSSSTSPAVLDLAVKMWSEGMADPSIVNDAIIIKGYTAAHVPLEDARNYSVLGCQEIEIPGKSNMGCEDGCFNLAKCMELALNDGKCRFTGLQLGLPTGEPKDFKTFDDVWHAYTSQIEYFVPHFVKLCNLGVEIRSRNLSKLVKMPLTDDCLKRGLDPDNGGAVYNFGEVETAGLSAAADSLTAIRKLVFDEGRISMEQLAEAIGRNFEGSEDIRQMLLNNAPKFGNDNALADEMACKAAFHFWTEIGKYKSKRGDIFFGACSLLESGIGYGKSTWALPDGRKAGEPLGNSIGPRTGADINGPTAMLRSVAKLPLHKAIGGTTCNVKLPHSVMNSKEARRKISAMIRTFLEEGGQMAQITPVDSEILREAQVSPEKYPDLIVRVGGFSIKFNELSTDSQNEIIARS